MDLLKRFLSSPGREAMKMIEYRGGVIKFRIPAHWREEYSDVDGGMFYGNRFDSGTLRLTILTLKAPKELPTESAMDVIQTIVGRLKSEGVEGTAKVRNDGNALFKYEEAASDREANLTIFYWIIANPLPPRHARLATFSYTILERQRNRPRVQRDLEMLETEIEAATLSPELGVVAR